MDAGLPRPLSLLSLLLPSLSVQLSSHPPTRSRSGLRSTARLCGRPRPGPSVLARGQGAVSRQRPDCATSSTCTSGWRMSALCSEESHPIAQPQWRWVRRSSTRAASGYWRVVLPSVLSSALCALPGCCDGHASSSSFLCPPAFLSSSSPVSARPPTAFMREYLAALLGARGSSVRWRAKPTMGSEAVGQPLCVSLISCTPALSTQRRLQTSLGSYSPCTPPCPP